MADISSIQIPNGQTYNFKDSTSRKCVKSIFNTETASGSIAHINLSENGIDIRPRIKKLAVNIDPVQSGTGDPSPDNVRPITGWTGANVNVAGKNLWTFGDVTVNGGNRSIFLDYPKPIGTFTISFEVDSTDTDSTTCLLLWTYKNGTSSGQHQFDRNQRVSRTFTTTDKIKAFTFYSSNNYAHGEGDTAHFKNIQIEIGATATQFDGYGSAYPISFGSAGTVYGGTLTYGGNGSWELTVDRAMVDLGTLAWVYSSSGSYFFSNGIRNTCKGVNDGTCSAYAVGTTSATNLPDKHFRIDTSTNNAGIVYVKDSRYTTAADFKAAVSGVQLVYPLVTPMEYILCGQDLETLLGENNIWADCGDVEVEYAADVEDDVARKNIESMVSSSSASGSLISLNLQDRGLNAKPQITKLAVNIDPVQSGTGDPSPDNVRPITGWTGANVNVAGKNILRITAISSVDDGVNFAVNQDGSISVKGTTTSDNCFFNLNYVNSKTVSFKKGTWKFTCGSIDSNIGIRVYQDSSRVGECYGNAFSIVTISPDANNAWCRIQILGKGTVVDTTVYPMFFNSEETDLAFEPYQGTTYHISFGSAGTVYGGTLDVTNGILTVNKAMVDMGTLAWVYASTNGGWLNAKMPQNAASHIGQAYGMVGLCSEYPVIRSSFDGFTSGDKRILLSSSSVSASNNLIAVKDSAYTDAATFTSAMSGVQLVYDLAAPITYQLTPKEVKTLLGENNIWCDIGDIDLEYRIDTTSDYVDPLLALLKSIIADNLDEYVAASNYSVGKFLVICNRFYKVTSSVTAGQTLTPGTNITETTIGDQLTALFASI